MNVALAYLAALSSLIAPVAVRQAQSPQTIRIVSRIGNNLNTPTLTICTRPFLESESEQKVKWGTT